MQIKQHLLDKRVIKRALQEGLVDKALYQKTLDELPDLSNRIQSDDDDDDDLDDDLDDDDLDDDENEEDELDEPPSSSNY